MTEKEKNMIVEISQSIEDITDNISEKLDMIAGNLDAIDRILDENQLIRARNIAVHDKDVRMSVSFLYDDSLDKLFPMLNEIADACDGMLDLSFGDIEK